MGYSWHPVFRQTEEGETPIVIDTHQAFSEMGGPEWTRVSYDTISRKREDINRRAQSTFFGFRMRVTMRTYFDDNTDSNYFTNIVNRMILPDWVTELSLDGAVTYHEVELDGNVSGPLPLAGKPFAGAHFQLPMRGRDLMAARPYLESSVGGGGTIPPPDFAGSFRRGDISTRGYASDHPAEGFIASNAAGAGDKFYMSMWSEQTGDWAWLGPIWTAP